MEQSKQNMASLTNEAAASSSSSSLPLSSTDHQNHYTYEVFLSFRGKDTRYDFSDHLYNALCLRGIKTFRDDKLSRGEDISQELLKAIEESRVSIVVFSQNYASSRWCLDELVKILDCRKSKGQTFRAVFYKVAPSDVRHQIGAFGDAFATLDQFYKDSMDKWKAALKEAADLSGWTFEEGRYETEFINDIVGELSTQVVNPSCEWHVAEYPIGLESCIRDVDSLLKAKENIFRMVGIWGTGGIGKTTIVKAVFNSIRHKFEGNCFLADVRSKSITQLQETLLFDILGENLKVHSVDEGVGLIKTRMQRKIVLLILDDVSDSSQLKNLVPSPDCFGPRSRVLITTRDKRWLIAHEVNEVYEVKMLDDRHALELFSLHAFKRNEPPSDYLELAQHVIHYAQGLPLALIVLGSHLFRRSTEEWEATIGSCKGGPQADIHRVLKLSYDVLGQDLKELFLDIACFFKGEYSDHVKPILEACYDHKTMVIGIAQLQEKALIRIDKDDHIWMHDLIEEMGKDIVYQESPDEPGKRSRVWSEEDVDYVLTNNTGTNKVIGIQFPWLSSTISLNAKSFSEMKNLRYISMRSISFSGDIDYLSNQLRWLDWEECPLQCFPSDFQANKLVELNITSCKIRRLWEGRKNFSRLTCMNLSECESLKELPDLSGIPNLKELDLSHCTSLKKLPDLSGIPNLKKLDLSCCKSVKELPDLSGIPNLKELDLIGCTSLKELPDLSGIPNLEMLNLSCCVSLKELLDLSGIPNLEMLNLSCCVSLKELPDLSGIPNLKELDLSECESLKELPDLSGIPNLKKLDLSGCKSLKEVPDLSGIPNLKELDLSHCTSLKELPDLSGIPNLKKLDLSHCTSLKEFPDLSGIPNLKKLDLRCCKSLKELPDLSGIPNLKKLDLSHCTSLKELPDLSGISNLKKLDLRCCKSLKELPDLSGIPNLEKLNLHGCLSLKELPDLSGIPDLKELNLSGCDSLKELPDLSGIPNLKGLNLSGCRSLKKLPNLSGIPNLKELILYGCTGLVEVPDSIRFLHNLVTLNVDHCSNLIMFPRKINLKSVETISISYCKLEEFSEVGKEMGFLRDLDLRGTCIKELHPSITRLIRLGVLNLGNSKLATFPKILVKMESLRWLSLDGSDIRELDESVENLIGLERLDLSECKNLTTLPCCIYGLQNLTDLYLCNCSNLARFPTNTKSLNVDGCSLSLPKLRALYMRGCSLLSDCDFLMTLDCWETLERLNLSRNNFVSLPACLTKFFNLKTLVLNGCKRLRGIPELPPNVDLYISGCESLEEKFLKRTNRGTVIEAASPSPHVP
ncbi:disease resistance protein RPV1 isoform X2 [Rosa chinensis]|uniref:disease resistance protein RPV1 isoform X2 n=1 Tax=Rosa chinensis TaxID=74649 RepID=UPI000D08D2D0|nr:disease resistance protein RPV1 isoform X2 [Rosa chinensis]